MNFLGKCRCNAQRFSQPRWAYSTTREDDKQTSLIAN
jgi:hypothetical protein